VCSRHQIELPVAVQITKGHAIGKTRRSADGNTVRKATAAIIQVEPILPVPMPKRNIVIAVAISITHGKCIIGRCHREAAALREIACPVIQEDRRTKPTWQRDDIERPIIVEIGECNVGNLWITRTEAAHLRSCRAIERAIGKVPAAIIQVDRTQPIPDPDRQIKITVAIEITRRRRTSPVERPDLKLSSKRLGMQGSRRDTQYEQHHRTQQEQPGTLKHKVSHISCSCRCMGWICYRKTPSWAKRASAVARACCWAALSGGKHAATITQVRATSYGSSASSSCAGAKAACAAD
jgi:hypothetical protein